MESKNKSKNKPYQEIIKEGINTMSNFFRCKHKLSMKVKI
jgi:hypothetical protein